ncbi:amino acid/polyamine transporter I [Leucosporidium creatinivorum]|uniref:Amino acid/polyamine transporter I n=1 Tax=Leucosporidium creatinivorum TaxID=106004 RepID=A0A1Y2DFC7_9BASI|nr:amino acid/polyamine transporter I [Leucosporidium creatinivorum]
MPAGIVDVDPEAHHHHQSAGEAADAARLAALGYDQELKRGWSLLESFGVSFSIISVVTGITTLFSFGLVTGGPGVMSVGWIVVSFFTMFVAFSMAEIVSAIPTSGGPYHWAALLAKPEHSAFAAWSTGWANFLGQVAVTCGITYGLAGLVCTTAGLHGFETTAPRQIGVYAALLVSHGIVNTFGIKTLAFLNRSSIALQSLGVGALAIALLAKAPTHRSAKEVFATFYDGTGGWSVRASPAYVAVIGVLLAQFTITGFDASAHMSEETHDAAKSAPIGVITAVGASSLFGFFLLNSYLFSIQDFDATVNTELGNPVLQIFVDVFGTTGATVAMTFVCLCIWHCGLFSITSNSRMMYAFSRDGALPRFFDHVDKKWSSPIRTVWLACTLAFILALPALGSSVAFAAATSIATIGLYISYAIPIAILAWDHGRFKKMQGPFNLGRASLPVAYIAIGWVTFITIAFCLPTANPVDSQTLNYTVVAVGIVAVGTFGTWFLWARRWFVGPRTAALEEASKEPGAAGS